MSFWEVSEEMIMGDTSGASLSNSIISTDALLRL